MKKIFAWKILNVQEVVLSLSDLINKPGDSLTG